MGQGVGRTWAGRCRACVGAVQGGTHDAMKQGLIAAAGQLSVVHCMCSTPLDIMPLHTWENEMGRWDSYLGTRPLGACLLPLAHPGPPDRPS